MATMQFELEMLGGAATTRLRRRRPAVDHLPWGTIDPGAFTADGLIEARKVWTNGVFTEYASAAAFTAMAGAFLECGAPIDLTAAAADIVVDELDHAEVASRLVMELGGAVPYHADLALVAPLTAPGATPIMRAAELAITTSCVGEALSVPSMRRARTLAGGGILHAVLDRLVRDEGPHAQLGPQVLRWAGDRISHRDRGRLAEIALDAVAVYAPLWQDGTRTEPADYKTFMTTVVRDKIDRRLLGLGIVMDRARLDALLA